METEKWGEGRVETERWRGKGRRGGDRERERGGKEGWRQREGEGRGGGEVETERGRGRGGGGVKTERGRGRGGGEMETERGEWEESHAECPTYNGPVIVHHTLPNVHRYPKSLAQIKHVQIPLGEQYCTYIQDDLGLCAASTK